MTLDIKAFVEANIDRAYEQYDLVIGAKRVPADAFRAALVFIASEAYRLGQNDGERSEEERVLDSIAEEIFIHVGARDTDVNCAINTAYVRAKAFIDHRRSRKAKETVGVAILHLKEQDPIPAKTSPIDSALIREHLDRALRAEASLENLKAKLAADGSENLERSLRAEKALQLEKAKTEAMASKVFPAVQENFDRAIRAEKALAELQEQHMHLQTRAEISLKALLKISFKHAEPARIATEATEAMAEMVKMSEIE